MRPQLNPPPITPSGGGFTLPLTPSLTLPFLVIPVVIITLLAVGCVQNWLKTLKVCVGMFASCFVKFFLRAGWFYIVFYSVYCTFFAVPVPVSAVWRALVGAPGPSQLRLFRHLVS